jgi:hypothetical protein
VRKEFSLEHAVHKRIWLCLRARANRKPVIFQRRRADELERSDGYRPVGLNLHLPVDKYLLDQVDVLLGKNKHAGLWLTRATKLRDKRLGSAREGHLLVA